MNRVCNTCNIEINENNYFKDRTVCKCCYNKNRRKNNNKQNQKPKVGKINNNNDKKPNISTNENHRHVIIGPSNVGKTFYMLKLIAKKYVGKDLCI